MRQDDALRVLLPNEFVWRDETSAFSSRSWAEVAIGSMKDFRMDRKWTLRLKESHKPSCLISTCFPGTMLTNQTSKSIKFMTLECGQWTCVLAESDHPLAPPQNLGGKQLSHHSENKREFEWDIVWGWILGIMRKMGPGSVDFLSWSGFGPDY